MLRGDLPLRTAIQEEMERWKTRGRPRQLILDWMMADFYQES